MRTLGLVALGAVVGTLAIRELRDMARAEDRLHAELACAKRGLDDTRGDVADAIQWRETFRRHELRQDARLDRLDAREHQLAVLLRSLDGVTFSERFSHRLNEYLDALPSRPVFLRVR